MPIVEPKLICLEEICVLLLHEFFVGHKATEATNNICKTMGQDIMSTRTAQRWFNQFNNGNYELNDLSRSGRPVEVDLDRLKSLIGDDPQLTRRCLAEQLGCSHTTVETLRKMWKYRVSIPHIYQLINFNTDLIFVWIY